MCADIDYQALSENGLLCFNAVDKTRINNNLYVSHTAQHDGSEFSFRSGWHYAGPGERQSLRLSIDRNTNGVCESWQDEHPMVALSSGEFEAVLRIPRVPAGEPAESTPPIPPMVVIAAVDGSGGK